jgi:hypothetical protein
MTSSALQVSLEPLTIELFSKDNYQKDLKKGEFSINLVDLLSSDLKKTDNSVVRVLDTWLHESIGSLRLVLFLEDLGPKSLQTISLAEVPSNDWELEAWRRSEESKFLSSLKQKEIEYLSQSSQSWLSKEKSRSEQVESLQVQLAEVESNLRGKMITLQKRETKISSLEEEIRLQMTDLQRQVDLKQEELSMWKEKTSSVKSGVAKESKSLKAQIQSTREEIRKIEEETVKFKRLAESQESKDLKVQLAQKLSENAEISRKWQLAKSLKEEVEATLFKLKGDLNKTLRVQDSERRVRQSHEREEIVKRRVELETIRYQHEECEQIRELKEKMTSFRTMIK